MYIIREGKKIELTFREAFEIYEEVQLENTISDLREVSEVPEDKLREVAEFCVHRLDNCDDLWEDYWCVLKETVKNKGYDVAEARY